MIAVACLGFWLFGIIVGGWAMWIWRELRDDDMARVLPPAEGRS